MTSTAGEDVASHLSPTLEVCRLARRRLRRSVEGAVPTAGRETIYGQRGRWRASGTGRSPGRAFPGVHPLGPRRPPAAARRQKPRPACTRGTGFQAEASLRDGRMPKSQPRVYTRHAISDTGPPRRGTSPVGGTPGLRRRRKVRPACTHGMQFLAWARTLRSAGGGAGPRAQGPPAVARRPALRHPLPEPFEGDGPRRDSARGGGGPMRAVSPGDPHPAVSPTLAFTQVGGPDVAPGHRRAAAGSRRERSRRAVAAIREGAEGQMAGDPRCECSPRGLAAMIQGLIYAQLGLCPARPAVLAAGARYGHSYRAPAAMV
jgi:hypothetical protein